MASSSATDDARYGISSFGHLVLINEGTLLSPGLQALNLGINVFLLIVVTLKLWKWYRTFKAKVLAAGIGVAATKTVAPAAGGSGTSRIWRLINPRQKFLASMFWSFFLSNTIRGAHVLDHIYRPVAYHEPKWLYQKYVLVEMELSTCFNVVTTLIGFICMKLLMKCVQEGNLPRAKKIRVLGCCMIYLTGIIAILLHYTIESPWKYGLMENLTIAGTGISAFPLICFVVYGIWRWRPSSIGVGSSVAGCDRGKKGYSGDQSLLEFDEVAFGFGRRRSRSSSSSKTQDN